MLHDELIRDRIVVGVRDRALSERMQLDTDLTLVKATLMAKQLESVKEQQSSLYQQDSVDQIRKMPNHIKETKRHEPKIRQFKSNQLGGSSHGCTRCGNSNNHDWKNCPAMNSYCSKCKKKGHYAKVCRSEAINEIKSEIAFLGSVEDNSKKWIVPIKVNNRQINFKIDTGADVNVLPLQNYYQSFQRIKLEKSDKILQGPNGIPLETVGMIHVKLQNKGQHLNSKIYIVNKLKQPLLSGETSEKLNIEAAADSVVDSEVEITEAATTAGKKATASLNVPNLPVVVDVAVDRAVMEAATTPATTAEKLATVNMSVPTNTAEDGGQEENQRKSKKACYTCGEFGHKKDDCPKSGTQESGDEEESSDNEEEETPQKRKQAEDSEEEEVEAEEPPKKKSKKKEEDCYLTLQAYRTMPLESARSREMRRPPLRHQPGSQGDARMTRSKRPRRIALHQRPHLQEMEGCRGTTKTRIQRRASLQMPAVHTRYGRAVKIPRSKTQWCTLARSPVAVCSDIGFILTSAGFGYRFWKTSVRTRTGTFERLILPAKKLALSLTFHPFAWATTSNWVLKEVHDDCSSKPPLLFGRLPKFEQRKSSSSVSHHLIQQELQRESLKAYFTEEHFSFVFQPHT
ncbi:hypothetical protein LAZ67_18001898 [Cordylochernes scorpioides]|uniref:CCHC-type domain-containing protein n=1 Tax=Cordylochernes scorpioides TaxID=51811 RepID=A0ABY6LG83_9ARAC|nr:hypothetical protein LAZ67_18001898 [Cordylochernes scorpioides]